jgi:anti-sigma regulatory factor (Ser/Thr protein kinase)
MKELTVDAIVENIPKVTDFVNEELESNGCPMKVEVKLDIAIDELFGNIARYAYGSNVGQATICIDVQKEPAASVAIIFIDRGKPYNPLNRKDPDTTLSAEERDVGGLGIFMVKKSMDNISYEYKDGQNILKIEKKF